MIPPAASAVRTARRRAGSTLRQLDRTGVALLCRYQTHRAAAEPYIRMGAAAASVLTLLLRHPGSPQQSSVRWPAQPREQAQVLRRADATSTTRATPPTSLTRSSKRTGVQS